MSGNNNGPVEGALAQLIRGIMVGIIREALAVLLRAYIFEVQRNQRAAEEQPQPQPQPAREALPRPRAGGEAPYRARRRLRAEESEEEEEDEGYIEPAVSEDDS